MQKSSAQNFLQYLQKLLRDIMEYGEVTEVEGTNKTTSMERKDRSACIVLMRVSSDNTSLITVSSLGSGLR